MLALAFSSFQSYICISMLITFYIFHSLASRNTFRLIGNFKLVMTNLFLDSIMTSSKLDILKRNRSYYLRTQILYIIFLKLGMLNRNSLKTMNFWIIRIMTRTASIMMIPTKRLLASSNVKQKVLLLLNTLG